MIKIIVRILNIELSFEVETPISIQELELIYTACKNFENIYKALFNGRRKLKFEKLDK